MSEVRAIAVAEEAAGLVDRRTLDVIASRRRSWAKARGPLIRRALLAADVVGFTAAFVASEIVFGSSGGADEIALRNEYLVFLATLPLWILFAKLYRLYDHDEEQADHTTLEDLVGVFHLVTVGAWLLIAGSWITGLVYPNLTKLAAFWAFAIVLLTVARAGARALCRRSAVYVQNAVVVGAGEVGQLVARKLVQHDEYGINVVGFVDTDPKERRADLADLPFLGSPERLPDLVRALEIDRVVVAFSRDGHDETVALVRRLRDLGVQIDIVPRLFEVVGPHAKVHSVESTPLVALPTPKRFPLSRFLKRSLDVVGASIGLLAASPLFAYAVWRIRRESPGPVFFRQVRLGRDMREFEVLKFRTMRSDTDDADHREFITKVMSAAASPEASGLYKLDREDAVTPFGRWLRKTSLDELPQLVNVLRGDMSLVGPRPCLAYETEHFAPHHFERFRVPAGITGLWQVTARAHSTFGEALDMDVAYARSWSLGLDLWLLCRTPLHILRRKATA